MRAVPGPDATGVTAARIARTVRSSRAIKVSAITSSMHAAARSATLGASGSSTLRATKAPSRSVAFIGSASLKVRLALFVERPHAFEAVLGRDHLVVDVDLEEQRRAPVHLVALVDGALCLAGGGRRLF